MERFSCTVQDRRGFTLTEVIVVVLIIGLFSGIAIPQYLKSVENTRAADAVALLKMAGAANIMYAQDHGNKFASDNIDGACNNGAPCGSLLCDRCQPVRCKYLAAQDWDTKPYRVILCNGESSSAQCGYSPTQHTGQNFVATVTRRTTGPSSTSLSPYKNWNYTMDVNGTITAYNGAPLAMGF